MTIKVVLGGEAVSIPGTEIGLGVAFIRVWVNGNGFTSASNQIGALGYILLEIPEIDVRDVNEERQSLFTQLHGQVVNWNIKPTLFVRNDGIARIAMTISVQGDRGVVVDERIEFVADNCTGISVVSNALDFSCTMLQEAKTLAELDSEEILSEDIIVAAVDAAPDAPEPNEANA